MRKNGKPKTPKSPEISELYDLFNEYQLFRSGANIISYIDMIVGALSSLSSVLALFVWLWLAIHVLTTEETDQITLNFDEIPHRFTRFEEGTMDYHYDHIAFMKGDRESRKIESGNKDVGLGMIVMMIGLIIYWTTNSWIFMRTGMTLQEGVSKKDDPVEGLNCSRKWISVNLGLLGAAFLVIFSGYSYFSVILWTLFRIFCIFVVWNYKRTTSDLFDQLIPYAKKFESESIIT